MTDHPESRMHRIYFDTNSATPDGRYDLTVRGSLADIARIADPLIDGQRVVLYMPGELEVEATLRFDADWNNGWTAIPDMSTLRYVDGSNAPA